MLDGRGLILGGPRSPIPALLGRYLERTARAFLDGHAGPQASGAVRAALLRDRRSTLACFASPPIGAAIHCAPLREVLPDHAGAIDRSLAQLDAQVLLELALRRLLVAPIELPGPFARLLAPALGVTIDPPPGPLQFVSGGLDSPSAGVALRLEPAAVHAPGPFTVTPAWIPLAPCSRLALVDENPIARFEAHPDKAGSAIDLGGHSREAWTGAIDASLALVLGHLPELRTEASALLLQIVPVGFHAERHLSASYREAIGTIYLTLHPRPMTLAEALVHELQHNKLNLASHHGELLENPFEPRFPSPVRPDPRPLWGILLAVHAFLPVAVLYRRMRAARHPLAQTPEFADRLDEIDRKNHEGMEMLRAHAEPTPAGRALLDELDALDRAHVADLRARGLATQPRSAHPD